MNYLRGKSQLVAALLLIAVVVSSAVLLYLFSVGLLGALAESSGIDVTIAPQIYSSEANIGILNENANFTFTIVNRLPSPQRIVINVTTGNLQVLANPIEAQAGA